MHVDVFDCYFLLAFAAMAIERLKQRRISARQLIGLGKVLAPLHEIKQIKPGCARL